MSSFHFTSILCYHPFDWVYLSVALAIELVQIPFWLLKYTIPSLRPVPQWTYKQATLVHILSAIVTHISRVRLRVPLSLKSGFEKERFVILEPAHKSWYRGPLESPYASPATIGGTWYPTPVLPDSFKQSPSGIICLHIHGGAFVLGDGRHRATGYAAHLLTKHGGVSRVFCPQYRLSGYPTDTPFPGAIQDTLTSYFYLTRTLKIPASQIVISGDSAGANIVIGFLRYIGEVGNELGLEYPSCAILISPYIATRKSLDPIYTRSLPDYRTDYISSKFGEWGARCYIGKTAVDSSEFKYINPEGSPFRIPIPLLVNTGGVEVPAKDSIEWAKSMKLVPGNDVSLYVEPYAVHDVMLVGNILGFRDEAIRLAKSAGEFIRKSNVAMAG